VAEDYFLLESQRTDGPGHSLARRKVACDRRFRPDFFSTGTAGFRGYEIHMGETHYENGAEPFSEMLRDGEPQALLDGAISSSGGGWGSYVHELFDDDDFRHSIVDVACQACGLAPAGTRACVTAERDGRIDRWAGHLRQSLDMSLIRGLVCKT
jgi:adenosylcobyric acid synthase